MSKKKQTIKKNNLTIHKTNMRLSLYQSNEHNPYRNLAIECYLAHNYDSGLTLYLWSNDNSVVIGKHQLAGKECNFAQLLADNGYLARRLSGGGAVYHDINNLCYTFIYDKGTMSIQDTYAIILNALGQLGLHAKLTGRNDIEIQGKKVSGNAYYTKGNTQVHHGTLLINTNKERMQRYLNVDREKLVGHGVNSVKSRVANLVEFDSSITKQMLCQAIIDSTKCLYGDNIIQPQLDWQYVAEKEAHLGSKQWLYNFENYDNSMSSRLNWGQVQVNYSINKGCISQLAIYTDCLDTQSIEQAKQWLIGKSLYGLTNFPNDITADIYRLCQQSD